MDRLYRHESADSKDLDENSPPSAQLQSKAENGLDLPPENISPETLYKDLPLKNDQIRLLRLNPLVSNDLSNDPTIQCELLVFSPDECPEYRALSYQWGAEGTTQSIDVNGRLFGIRRNLWQLLKTALAQRWLDGLWLWVDQICINQADIPERNSQVQRMGTIFERAEEVLIWLGHYGPTGDVALKEIRESRTAQTKARQFPYSLSGHSYFLFINNEYWNRLWVAQEIHIAQSLRLFCSDTFLSWDDLSVLDATSVSGHLGLIVLREKSQGGWISTRGLRSSGITSHMSLGEALISSRHSSCTEPRDYVYALMGLLDPKQRFQVDYSKSTAEVFHDVILGLLPLDDQGFWHGNHLVEMLLRLAIRMKLLRSDRSDDDSTMEKLFNESSVCDHHLLVVTELVWRRDTVPMHTLEYSPDYARSFRDLRQTGSSIVAQRGADLAHFATRSWRRDLKLPELLERINLYNSIIQARSEWSWEWCDCGPLGA